VNTIYRVGYFNPYATIDGISSGFDISYRNTDAFQMNVANYSTDVFAAGLNFGFPLNEFDSIRVNFDYENTKLNSSSRSSTEILDFINRNGSKYNTYSISLGWAHDTLNRAIFANKGGIQRLSILTAVPLGDLEYYKASYRQQHYFPLAKNLTLLLDAEVAYGDGYNKTKDLPFFENYYAGGVQSVRGFQANTLGPLDHPINRSRRPLPLGARSKLVGTAEVLFPVPFLDESKNMRLGAFVDAGNVFTTFGSCSRNEQSCSDLGDIKYSTGISARWLSPFGALVFSVAQPLNAERIDQVQNFQFSFGSGF
jgi:outer membrane protein insertion porin family